MNIHGGKADYDNGEEEDVLDWVKKQQKDREQAEIDDSMDKEMENLGNG